MENKENIQQPISTKNKWYAPYIVAGLIIGASQSSVWNDSVGKFIILFLAIGAGFFYYPVKSKIKIKNEAIRVIVTFLILEIIAGFLAGASAGLINGLISKSGNQQKMAACQSFCNYRPTQNSWLYNSKWFQTQEQCLNYCLVQ